jgi:hypothetical protein
MDNKDFERLTTFKSLIFEQRSDGDHEVRKPIAINKNISSWKQALRTKPKTSYKNDKQESFWALNKGDANELMDIWIEFGQDNINRSIVQNTYKFCYNP